jgi:hypothetical protein
MLWWTVEKSNGLGGADVSSGLSQCSLITEANQYKFQHLIRSSHSSDELFLPLSSSNPMGSTSHPFLLASGHLLYSPDASELASVAIS